MKQLVLFIERKLEKKDHIQLSFFSQPDGPIIGNGAFKSSVLVPGLPEAFFVGPPLKEKLPKNAPPGAVLLGSISYGTVTLNNKNDTKNNQQSPASYHISYLIPSSKADEDKGKGTSACTKSVSERLEEEVRDAKIKFLSSLKRDTEEEKAVWKELTASFKSEYPNYTPLLAKILESLLSGAANEDKFSHSEEASIFHIITAANEVIDSVDREELAKYFSLKPDPDEEEAEKVKKKMEATRDQLAEALYQKGLALADIESCKVLNDVIEDESEPPKKKLYDLRIQLLDEIGWAHVGSYEKQWMHVRFPSCLPLF
ncbi:Tripeptidyl-peptidase 2 [Ananas comosus]|uniref:Tripeptidyl-peptidase 2 n=1 Tax=Ananas comosus TaxID=4615 RepID=A0A199UZ51_ANACO|nr:Tripeptidyl-peptidase 2 [Ananas comosus]